MKKSMLPRAAGRAKDPAAAGKNGLENNSAATKSNPEILVKPLRAFVRWPGGLDAPPEILPMGDTDVETEQIRAVLMKVLKLGKASHRTERTASDER